MAHPSSPLDSKTPQGVACGVEVATMVAFLVGALIGLLFWLLRNDSPL